MNFFQPGLRAGASSGFTRYTAGTAALAVLAAALPTALAQGVASLAIVNAQVWTGNAAAPRAEAIACIGSRIAAIGSSAEIRKWIGPGTRVIEAGGKLVVPGFNDSHVHLVSGGQHLASVRLRDAESETVFRNRLRDYAAKAPKGRWILGGDWDHESWTPARLPTRALVDDITTENPLFVNRLDGHMALANAVALRMAGITKDTPDPPGGAIVRDANGEPTGVVKDAAMDLVRRVIPAPSAEELTEAARLAMREAKEHGVTSVHDVETTPEKMRVYQNLLRAGELTLRISTHQPISQWQRLADAGIQAGFGNTYLQAGALKGFSDGSLGSTTALFFEPFTDAPHTSGLPNQEMIPESRMMKNLEDADQAGLQLAVHAIGDKANDTVLRMFADVARKNGPRDRRFRIEHAQHLRREDVARFKTVGVIASMQPYHAIDDGRWATKRIGPERSKGTYAFRWLLDAGAVLAFGSDWYVAPLDPVMGIYAAVTRRTLDEKNPNGWVPEQKITVEEALRAYTFGSAYASFTERFKGTIEPGKLADLVIVSDNLLTMEPAKIREAKVVMTIFDGRVIYER